MNHMLIFPVLLPALVAPVMIIALRYHISLQRIFSVATAVLLVAISLTLTVEAADGSVQVYELGAWEAPFGIVLVLDRLSALMILLTSGLGLAVLLYAIGTGWDERGSNFHPLFLFQMMGILGAFLTGDAFNLFVFFEVLLIASYGLMIHAGGAERFRAGVQYVVYNLLGSTLFLFALGTIYSVTGTLNMADLALRVAELPPEDTALMRVGAILLLLVFAIKAAVLPLHFWLPATYANAPAPIAALFAIMTKVGAYAILRIYTLVYGPDSHVATGLVGEWLLPAALLTLAVGAIGILGSRSLARLVAFGAVTSMGTLLIALSLFTPEAAAAVIYYTVHSTLAGALLFLIADLVIDRQGEDIAPKPLMAQSGLISVLFFVGAIALAGMPPLSGFLGKLLVMDAARDHELVWWIWGVILVSSLITIIGLARAGSLIFWKSHGLSAEQPDDTPVSSDTGAVTSPLAFSVCFALIAALVLMTIFAGPLMTYAEATAEQLFQPTAYLETVLGGELQ